MFVLSCCILHIICEIHGDEFNDDCLEDSELDRPDDTTSPGWWHSEGSTSELFQTH